ncbi:mechanosensitive ion channel [Mucilaginibacter sp. RS28]|uniref:Mechanosensitive ion channel n=1 Tax=Mucilaginibacter straminoryzae TaxID=2932774 RepID=A0A9X2BA70_9SPHI|nr:mechanosensitive ion channel domain-containing protein [Mucilaginibacter straminoryzae]MCJ8211141.1 mechanosensitive ion channel [Mucilaginibacter straminoryzae]
MLQIFRNRLLFTLLLLTVTVASSLAQKHHKTRSDSLRQSILRRDSLIRSLQKSDTSLNNLLKKVEYYSNSFNQISVGLTRGFDTVDISSQLPIYQKRVGTIKRLIENDKSNTLRYLYAIRDFLTHTEDQLDEWQDDLAKINNNLVQMRNDLNEIQKDTSFRTLPSDSSLQKTAILPIKAVLNKHQKLDSLNKIGLLKIGLLQNRLADVYLNVLDEKDQINAKIRNFSHRALDGEYDFIWDIHSSNSSNFREALSSTINMNSKLLRFLIVRDTLIHIIGFGILSLFLIWILSNRLKIFKTKKDPREILRQANYVAAFPVCSAIVMATVLQPYFYDHPPAVFLECIFLVNIIAVLHLVYKTCTRAYFNYLASLLLLTLIAAASNLFVEVSDTDRYVTLLMSGAAAFISFKFLNILRADDTRLPYSITIIKFYAILQALAFLCNVLGYFTLSKIIAVTATFNLWQAISLYLFVQILMQSLFLQLEANKGESIISSYLDFKLLQNKFRSLLNIIALILWFITLAQNLSVEDWAFDTMGEFLNTSRKVGGTSFTFTSLLIFVAVIWLSTIASKIISYFYDYAGQQAAYAGKKKSRTSVLIVKLTVYAIGFLIAVAASGVPLDKITIIISAFGVGIGFGLQNIVNNLVSGLILAFEKPVQIGDIVEVSGRSGTITEIGIRSSKIATGEGAEVIVPNGDLISQHVINWTLSNNNRRVELIIQVNYGSDLEKVKQLLTNLLASREDIMTTPSPSVFVHNFSADGVDFRLFFWAADISMWLSLKSQVLAEIYQLFAKEGIEIPFPQRDIHLTLDKDATITLKKTDQDQDQ